MVRRGELTVRACGAGRLFRYPLPAVLPAGSRGEPAATSNGGAAETATRHRRIRVSDDEDDMARWGISDAFRRYGACLRNVQWSVSAWTPADELVVSVWQHHYRTGPDGTAEFADSLDRWGGPGNQELRRNLQRAFDERRPLRLVIASTVHADQVQAGADASRLPMDFDVREELVGEVAELDGTAYVLRFRRVGPRH